MGLPSAPAQVLLVNGTNGFVEAVVDGAYVTQLRTGAATGGQASKQLEAMVVVRELGLLKYVT